MHLVQSTGSFAVENAIATAGNSRSFHHMCTPRSFFFCLFSTLHILDSNSDWNFVFELFEYHNAVDSLARQSAAIVSLAVACMPRS